MGRIRPTQKGFCENSRRPFYYNFVSKYGAAVKLVSDYGFCFISDIFKALCDNLEISHGFTVPYW